MGTTPTPEWQLAASASSAQRVEELYTAHARLVRSVCRSLLRDRNEAEDAVQQTFLSAQRALAKGSSPREPAAWLAAIARHECFVRVRERMREPLPIDAEPTAFGADAYAAAASRYEVATLREALADLPRAQREAILLRELRGLSYDEVARALSVTTAAVESLIFRARRTLQGKLGGAMHALSPVALLGRLLGGAGGDPVGPTVAKVAAIGVGATILAGGAAVGPRAFGLGHAATKVEHAAPRVHVYAAPPVVSTPSAHVWSRVAPEPAHTWQADNDPTVAESSDTAESSSPETDNEARPIAAVTPSSPAANPTRDDGASDDGGTSDDSSSSDNSAGSGD
jgi:RNA polymerase sigma-70 factor (ECF subfamily)